MTRSPILFRVDGTSQHGWESLWRCLVFAAALQRRRRPTYFLSQLDPPTLAAHIKRVGNEWLDADSPAGSAEDLEELVQEVRRLTPAAVILDAPNLSDSYLETVQAAGTLVVSLDHLAATRFPSRLVVNPLLGPGKDDYEF